MKVVKLIDKKTMVSSGCWYTSSIANREVFP